MRRREGLPWQGMAWCTVISNLHCKGKGAGTVCARTEGPGMQFFPRAKHASNSGVLQGFHCAKRVATPRPHRQRRALLRKISRGRVAGRETVVALGSFPRMAISLHNVVNHKQAISNYKQL